MGILSKSGLRTYALFFLAWTVAGLFFFSQGLTQKLFSHDPTPWWHYLVSWLVGVYTSAFLTPVVLFVQLAWEAAILPYLGVFPAFMKGFVGTFLVVFMLGFHGNITTYFTLLGIQYGFI